MERIDCLTRENTHGGLAVTSGEMYTYPPHAHAYCEMTLYEPFEGTITVNDQCVDMRAGYSVILMTPLDVHRIGVTSSRGARFIKIAFDEESVPASLPAAPLIMQRLDAGALVCQLFRELHENRADRPYAAALTAAMLAGALPLLLRLSPQKRRRAAGLLLNRCEFWESPPMRACWMQCAERRKICRTWNWTFIQEICSRVRTSCAARWMQGTTQSFPAAEQPP